MSPPALWSCGVLGKVHGLRGEFYLNLAPHGLEYLSLGERFHLASAEGAERLVPCAVTRTGGTDQRPLVRLDLAATRDEALALQGAELVASGGELDALPHYRVGDLVGRPVETAAGRHLGEVSDVLQAPAHELLEIRGPGGATRLVPLVDELVTVDEAGGVVRIAAGLLDDEEEA